LAPVIFLKALKVQNERIRKLAEALSLLPSKSGIMRVTLTPKMSHTHRELLHLISKETFSPGGSGKRPEKRGQDLSAVYLTSTSGIAS